MLLGNTTAQKPKIKAKQPQEQNQIEVLRSTPQALGGELKKASTDSIQDMWRQILSPQDLLKSQMGELRPNQELNLRELEGRKKAEKQPARGAIDYTREILSVGENKIQRENHEVKQQVEQIVIELKRLSSSAKAIETQIAVATGHVGSNPGRYHVNFFEWLLTVVKDARRKVEDAGAWLNATNSKSKKKQQVGKVRSSMNLFLSGERTAQNQTG